MRPDRDTLIRLYVDERKTTYEIGAVYGVDRVSITRWLKKDGIPMRPGGTGLVRRGVEPPTAAELDRLLNVEHIGYQGVAEKYGVHPTAVGYWCRRLGIKSPTIWETRYGANPPHLPNTEALADLYANGLSLDEIGDRFGVSGLPIATRLKAAGVVRRADGWGGKRFACSDGHEVRSTYERRVDDWLSEHGIAHTYEPAIPWDLRSRSDFMANGWYVEIWGVRHNPVYAARQARKRAGYSANGAALVEINHYDFSTRRRGRWMRLLSAVINPPAPLLL